METKNVVRFLMMFILLTCLESVIYAQNSTKEISKKGAGKYKVTFIELGSVRCIPCQQMQGVMKSIEKKYGGQVNVVFHDVWTPEGKPFGKQYGIGYISTADGGKFGCFWESRSI